MFPGQLRFADVPVQVPRLDSVTLGTVGQGGRAVQVKDGKALGTLGDAFQVEGVDGAGVATDLADEALALAQDAGEDVLAAEARGVA